MAELTSIPLTATRRRAGPACGSVGRGAVAPPTRIPPLAVLIPLILLGVAVLAAGVGRIPQTSAFQSRLNQIVQNENSAGPWSDVTLTAAEANAWFAGPGAKKLPQGVKRLIVSSQPGEITGNATINFDEIEGRKQGNPLLSMIFSGTHEVVASAHVDSAQAPAAKLTVDTVRLDGQRIPNALIDFAVDTFIRPTHPEIGRTFQVPLPKHVKSAVLGTNEVTLRY